MSLDYSYPQKMRLLKSQQFDAVFSQARSFKVKGWTVLAVNNAEGHPRLGLVVSKRHLPQAVLRNRFKRQVRETFRLMQHTLKFLDFVVIPSPKARYLAIKDLRSQLEHALLNLSRTF